MTAAMTTAATFVTDQGAIAGFNLGPVISTFTPPPHAFRL